MLAIFSLYLIIIADILGWGIALSVLAPLMLSPNDFSSTFSTFATRSIFLGILFSLYAIAQFFGAPLLDKSASRYGRKSILTATALGSSIAFFLSSAAIWTNSFTLMFTSRLIAGFFAGNQNIVQSSIYHFSSQMKKERAKTIYASITNLSFILGPFLGGLLSDHNLGFAFTLSTPFLCLSLLFFLAFIFMCLFYEKKENFSSQAPSLIWKARDLSKVFQNSSISIYLMIYFICILGWFFYVIFLPAYLYDQYHFDQGAIGDHMGYLALSFAIGSFVQNLVHPKSQPKKKGTSILFLALGCLCIYSTSLTIHKDWLWLLIGLSGLFIAVWWGLFIQNLQADTERPFVSKTLEIASQLWSIGLIVAPILAAFVLAHGAKYPIVLGGVFLFIAIMIQAIFSKKLNKRKEHV